MSNSTHVLLKFCEYSGDADIYSHGIVALTQKQWETYQTKLKTQVPFPYEFINGPEEWNTISFQNADELISSYNPTEISEDEYNVFLKLFPDILGDITFAKFGALPFPNEWDIPAMQRLDI